MNTVLGILFVDDAVHIETAIHIPLTHNAVRIAVEVQHLENVVKFCVEPGFDFFSQIDVIQIQRYRNAIRILHYKFIDDLIDSFINFSHNLHFSIAVDELKVINDGAVEIEIVSKVATSSAKLHIERAILIIRWPRHSELPAVLHALKGASANAGALELAQLAGRDELALRSEAGSGLTQDDLHEYLRAFRRLQQAIAAAGYTLP